MLYLKRSWTDIIQEESLLLIEATKAVHRLHQHEHQLVVGATHLLPKLLPTARQLGEVPEQQQ